MSQQTLQKHFHGFLRSLRNKRLETRGTYERALRTFILWFREDKRCGFQKQDIERYKRYLERKRKLSDVSVSTYLTAVRRFCEYLVRVGVLQGNPAREVGGNRRPLSHSRETLTPSDVDALVAVVDANDERGLRDLAFIRLMVHCGLSEIEIIRANVTDLRRDGGVVGLLVQGKGKTTKDATVTLPPEIDAIISRYLATRRDVKPADPLFASAGNRTRGERMTTRGVRERVNRCLSAAGLRKGKSGRVSPYSLRHTAAVIMAAAGATPDEIRERMRLGSLETAMLYIKEGSQLQEPQ